MVTVPSLMAKPHRSRTTSLLADTLLFASGATSSLILLWAFSSFPSPNLPQLPPRPAPKVDPLDPTFYDDPWISYSVGEPVNDWDKKRQTWLNLHPSLVNPGRVLLLTGSQTSPCRSPVGDNLLLRFFKNKVDYCRIHGHDIFYNNALLHPQMNSFWAKLPVVRASMVAHPETEWIWWVDSDAAITDMEFRLPLERYKDHNLVAHGWFDMVFDNKSWTSLNAGVFLIRNCQWSMDFLEAWSEMGPQSPDYEKWGAIQRKTLKDKLFPKSDDQAALIYLILKQQDRWADKIYLEGEYYLQGYWQDIIGGPLFNTASKYIEMEKGVRRLRRRHAERVSRFYGEMREAYLRGVGAGKGSWRRPFITHFTGCQPCSGAHNSMYSGDICLSGMEAALNFADNQVLRRFGFLHPDIHDSSSLIAVPFDYPA